MTLLDAQYLLKLVLNQDNTFCKEATISDEQYKIKCISIDSNGTETKFVIEFL